MTSLEIVEKKDRRSGKGRVITLSRRVYRIVNTDVLYVESESNDDLYYYVMFNTDKDFGWCSCKSFENHHMRCKHLHDVEYAIRWGTVTDTEKLPTTVKKITTVLLQQQNQNHHGRMTIMATNNRHNNNRADALVDVVRCLLSIHLIHLMTMTKYSELNPTNMTTNNMLKRKTILPPFILSSLIDMNNKTPTPNCPLESYNKIIIMIIILYYNIILDKFFIQFYHSLVFNYSRIRSNF
jgi:hypothetical protein